MIKCQQYKCKPREFCPKFTTLNRSQYLKNAPQWFHRFVDSFSSSKKRLQPLKPAEKDQWWKKSLLWFGPERFVCTTARACATGTAVHHWSLCCLKSAGWERRHWEGSAGLGKSLWFPVPLFFSPPPPPSSFVELKQSHLSVLLNLFKAKAEFKDTSASFSILFQTEPMQI